MAEKFVEVWHGDILPEEPEQQDYSLFLNRDEKQKAASFSRFEFQKKYIKTRGLLRKVLSDYINEPPQKLVIKTGLYGKPFLADQGLFFNLSHTGNKFVIAVSNCSEIGIDLEQHKSRASLPGLVEKCFSEQEKAYWITLSKEQKTSMFYRFWVRKEAFVKAVGRGIALGLDQCVVNPYEQNCFLSIPMEYGLVEDWNIVDVTVNEADFCAVVLKKCRFNYKQMEVR